MEGNAPQQQNATEEKREPSRFDYVEYDGLAMNLQADLKSTMTSLENFINFNLKSPRAKALALTKLEEFYMWTGKAIRDDQITRNGTVNLQEQRINS